jgi:hypothetical protein
VCEIILDEYSPQVKVLRTRDDSNLKWLEEKARRRTNGLKVSKRSGP